MFLIEALRVEVYGHDAGDRKATFAAVKRVLEEGGDTAKSVRKALSVRLAPGGAGPKPLEFILVRDYGSFTVPGSNTIVIDTLSDIDSIYDSVRPGGRFTFERIVAHEIGHAALGLYDLKTDSMQTINGSENPIMNALGDTNDRRSYNWER